jgi:hypothetical protein
MITKNDAIKAGYRDEFHHVSLTNADGTPVRCRVNGKCKVWKRDPQRFSLPVKYGMKQCFYLDELTAHLWVVGRGS